MDEERFQRHDLVGAGEYSVRVRETQGRDVPQDLCLTIYYKNVAAGNISMRVHFLRDAVIHQNMEQEEREEKEKEARIALAREIQESRKNTFLHQSSKIEIMTLLEEIEEMKQSIQCLEQ